MISRKTCQLFIDYESLLVNMSLGMSLDVESLILEIVQRAQRQYELQAAFVLADWRRIPGREWLERNQLICIDATMSGTGSFGQAVQSLLLQNLWSNPVEVVLFASGKADYADVLQQVLDVGQQPAIWSISPVPPAVIALCADYEAIFVTNQDSSPGQWPRVLMLHTLAVLAEELERELKTAINFSDIEIELEKIPAFGTHSKAWLNIAIRERLFYLQLEVDGQLSVVLNREHGLVRNALQIRNRVLCTLRALSFAQDDVPFSRLERALRSYKLLLAKQRLRQAWIEMLACLQAVTLVRYPVNDTSLSVTMVYLNSDHPMVIANEYHTYHNLIRLILVIVQHTALSKQQSISTSTLLNYLTSLTTHAEAHLALAEAQQRNITQAYDDESYGTYQSVTKLNSQHPDVIAIASQRDALIQFVRSLRLTNQGRPIGRLGLLHELERYYPDPEQAAFWIQLLIDLNLLFVHPRSAGLGEGMLLQTVNLNDGDPVVHAVLESI